MNAKSYGRERIFLYIVFSGLLLMKGLLPSRDGDVSFSSAIVPAVMYAALLGSPQLFWIFKTRSLKNRPQSVVAALTALFFLAAYLLLWILAGATFFRLGLGLP